MKYYPRIYSALLILSLALTPTVLIADSESSYATTEREFQEFVANLTPGKLSAIRFQLLTATPGKTVTTAFGHSALRVFSGKECGPHSAYNEARCLKNDYYIDFGQYDESAGFLWRFLRGNARFYAHALPMAASFQGWESLGRGLFAQDLKLTPPQKMRMFKLILRTSENFSKGYDYENFSKNCVTYVRDILSEATGTPLELKDLDEYTWRSRVTRYTRTLFWLRINEKLLFDRDTDRLRSGSELIFTPHDLQAAVENAGLADGPLRQMLPDRWAPIDASISFDDIAFWAAFFILLTQLTSGRSRVLQIWGNRLLAVCGTIAGLVVWFVWLFTSFDFMNETIMILAFTPLDFLLWRAPFRDHTNRLLLYFGAVRLAGVILGIALILTTHPQSVGSVFSFLLVFFALYTYRRYSESRNPPTDTVAA